MPERGDALLEREDVLPERRMRCRGRGMHSRSGPDSGGCSPGSWQRFPGCEGIRSRSGLEMPSRSSQGCRECSPGSQSRGDALPGQRGDALRGCGGYTARGCLLGTARTAGNALPERPGDAAGAAGCSGRILRWPPRPGRSPGHTRSRPRSPPASPGSWRSPGKQFLQPELKLVELGHPGDFL